MLFVVCIEFSVFIDLEYTAVLRLWMYWDTLEYIGIHWDTLVGCGYTGI